MDLNPAEQNELERLADTARHEIETQAWTSVSEPFTGEARAALAAMTERLVAAGVDRKVAEWATTIWICGGQQQGWTVARCLEQAEYYAEIGLIQPAGR